MSVHKAHIEEIIDAAILWNSEDGDKPDPAPPEWEAVFRLIRSAPDMAKALKDCLGVMQTMRHQIDQMRGLFGDHDETIKDACEAHDQVEVEVERVLAATKPPVDVRTNHFARLNDYRNTREYAAFSASVGHDAPQGDLPSLLGQRWEIDEEIYNEFLEMMPPRYWRGGSFYMAESLFGNVAAKFSREGERYFCEYARLPRPPGQAPSP